MEEMRGRGRGEGMEEGEGGEDWNELLNIPTK